MYFVLFEKGQMHAGKSIDQTQMKGKHHLKCLDIILKDSSAELAWESLSSL